MARNAARFPAILRGINVGGKNVIAKDDLRLCFENLGFTNVRTYIQSGKFLFRSEETSAKKLTEVIEAGLSDRFSYSWICSTLKTTIPEIVIVDRNNGFTRQR